MAVFIGVFVIIPSGIMLFDTRPVIHITNAWIEPDPAAPGQTIRLTWTAVEKRSCSGSVQLTITDSAHQVFYYTAKPTIYHEAKDSTPVTFINELTLPISIRPGPAIYSSYVTRWCNPLQYLWPITEPRRTINFTIK
jgi:hypothetical protein